MKMFVDLSFLLLLLLVQVECSGGAELLRQNQVLTSNIAVLKGIKAEVFQNNSLVAAWTGLSRPTNSFYLVTIADSNGYEQSKYIQPASQDKQRVMFDNLLSYKNYSLKVRRYDGHKYVPYAEASIFTFPNAPSAPRLKECTSSSIVLSFDRVKEDRLQDFRYYAEEAKQNRKRGPDGRGVQCDSRAAVCRIEGLRSNTAYQFVLKACATKPSQLCSLNSRESGVLYTTPEAPDAPSVKESTSTSITVTYTKKPSREDLKIYVRASPEGADAAIETRDAACSNEEATCHLSGLHANRAYVVSLKACTIGGEERCSQLSASTTAYTAPSTPSAPRLKESTSSSIVLSFDRVKEDRLQDLRYYANKAKQNRTRGPDARGVLCDSTAAVCRIEGLRSNTAYQFVLKACATKPSQRCSQNSRATEVLYTTQETPDAPTTLESSADSITVTYTKKASLANLAVFARASAADGGSDGFPEVACNNDEATCYLRGLKANRAYVVSLRACSTDPNPRCSPWSDPKTLYTAPSALAAPTMTKSTSNSITVTYKARFVPTNLAVFVRASPVDGDKAFRSRDVPCNYEAATCHIGGLEANRAYAVSLKACPTDHINQRCSQWSQATTAYTKPSRYGAGSTRHLTGYFYLLMLVWTLT